MNASVTLSRSIQATEEAVFRSVTTSTGLLDWCADAAEVFPHGKGPLFLWTRSGYQLLGSIEKIEKNVSVLWEMAAPSPGKIQFKIKPGETDVSLSMDLSVDGSIEEQLAFWDPALNNLKVVLETGLDRRVYDRPMLGILIAGMLDEDSQPKYKSPVPYGVILSGTIPGLGAARLGLVENDILVEMNGIQLKDYQAITEAMSGYKSGETIQTTWYRKGELTEGALSLSGRPEPFIPPTPAELAEYVKGIYDRLDAELAEILEGVTEAEADYSPAEKEWSTKEILAHKILTERGAQIWIGATIDGDYLKNWASNDNSLVRAIVDVHPTLSALTDELHRTEAETIALLQRLPSELVTHRGVYVNIVTMLGEHGLPVHTRSHYEVIRTQVEAARGTKK